MKYVIVRCEDTMDIRLNTVPLLEGARTNHLRQLAQSGCAGVIRRGTSDRFQVHRSMLGVNPNEAQPSAGSCYAAAAKLELEEDETVWSCELVTQQDGRITDTTAGEISGKEAQVLLEALNEQLGTDTRSWRFGEGSHHVLLLRDKALESGQVVVPFGPDALLNRAWRRTLPKGKLGNELRVLLEQSAKVLETHPINRVRVDLGENPANMLWIWGGSPRIEQKSLSDRTGFSGALVSRAFFMRGLAQCLGLEWVEGIKAFDKRSLERLSHTVNRLLERHDLVYVHVEVDSTDAVKRLCATERLDQVLLKPLTECLSRSPEWRLLVVVDERASRGMPFIADGTGLARHPSVQLDVKGLTERGFEFKEAVDLFSWFTKDAQAVASGK